MFSIFHNKDRVSFESPNNSNAIFFFLEMGAEHYIPLYQRLMQASPWQIISTFKRAALDALRATADEPNVPSEQIEHAWDPEDCSPRFRVLSDRLTARRLPSPLTTDAIRGTQLLR